MMTDYAQDKKVTTGIVGFFDILGYQNIIDNNEIGIVSSLISETLTKLPSKVKADVSNEFSGKVKQIIESYFTLIQTRLISDSILISVPIRIEGSDVDQDTCIRYTWILLLYYAARLTKEMFDSGLPIRGAIDYGEYYLDNHCFAGKPIIDCYRLSEQLEMSGVVLSEAAYKHYLDIMSAKEHAAFKNIGIEYLVPIKNNTEVRMFMLDWYKFDKLEFTDIRQEVYKSFRGHNKDIQQKVISKVVNTEFAIRALFINHSTKQANEQLPQ